MRIVHLINNLATGGAEKLLTDLVPQMRVQGYDVHVLLINDNASKYHISLLQGAGVPVKVLQTPLYGLAALSGVFRELRKYDVIHAHLFPAFYYAAIARMLFLKGKIVTTEHSTTNKRSGKWYLRVLDRFVYRLYDHIIAISDDVRNSLIRKGVAPGKISVISNGINLNSFSPQALAKKLYKIGMAGRLKHPKDQDVIIRALPALPEHVSVVFAGEGDREDELRQLAGRLGVDDRVEFIGITNDMPGFYRQIDIHVFASNSEGFGIACIESMAAGIPTVASDIPALSGIVKGYGLLFAKNNEHELATQIRRLYKDEELYCKIAEDCFHRAQDFGIQRTSEQYIQIYYHLNNYVRNCWTNQ